jgi:hypothetical protein
MELYFVDANAKMRVLERDSLISKTIETLDTN